MPGKKFRFSLQKVLELRHHETERARQSLADAEQALEQKKEQLEHAREHLDRCQRTVQEGDALRPAQLRQAGAFREDARQSVADARAAVKECRQRVEDARAELQEARQGKDAFEELRDQEKEQHDREQTKAEIAFFDEQAVLRHARSSNMSLTQDL
jgi:flagellar export protein FliJ